jgi:putative DNA primase/helicase
VSEGARKFHKIWDADMQKPKARDGGLGHDELRDRWLELYPNHARGPHEWMSYERGIWTPVHDNIVNRQVVDVLERSRDEEVKVTDSLTSGIRRLAEYETFVPKEMWNSDTDVMVFENGTLEIHGRNFREHRPDDYATARLPYEYDPEATCDVFRAVVEGAIPDVADALQEFAGYCLTTNTGFETALWLKGPRGSGKSTVIEGFAEMLGPKHGILGLGEIEMSRFALGRIPGKTLLTSTEQPASYLKSTHVVDALISGETLTVERKGKDAEEIRPVAKVIWAMNDAPRIANTTSGIFRRVKIIEFPELQRQRDPAVKEYVKTEAPGILNWALEGLTRLEERGRFEWPRSVTVATEAFQMSNDLPAQFVDEMCETGPLLQTSTRFLYEKYAQWCEDGGHKAASITRTNEEWKRLGFTYKKTKKDRFWLGVQVKFGEGSL